MKVEYRIRNAEKQIRQLLKETNEKYSCIVDNHIGKEFNTQEGWKLHGKREALKGIIDILANNNLLYF